jgi:hypothetical protein
LGFLFDCPLASPYIGREPKAKVVINTIKCIKVVDATTLVKNMMKHGLRFARAIQNGGVSTIIILKS